MSRSRAAVTIRSSRTPTLTVRAVSLPRRRSGSYAPSVANGTWIAAPARLDGFGAASGMTSGADAGSGADAPAASEAERGARGRARGG
ncbi:putative cellulose synthase, regulatory subunit BscB domain protein [Burkholderia pseudomallei MSHR435]|nr:putative cellulose synthase, regulatory subunit BscB domain protein [Burkholderia pseudomallei MSHR435]